MDPVTIACYALVCGCLAVASPRVSPAALRLLLGIAVGLLAAAALSALRRATGLQSTGSRRRKSRMGMQRISGSLYVLASAG